jgi:ABC-type antimicrobial peptide transport system permease subunit
MAIGALRVDIVRMVLGQGLRWVAIGVLAGLGGVFALARVVRKMVYGMEGLTPTPLLLATVTITLAAVAACALPARRAARLDPIQALRSD